MPGGGSFGSISFGQYAPFGAVPLDLRDARVLPVVGYFGAAMVEGYADDTLEIIGYADTTVAVVGEIT